MMRKREKYPFQPWKGEGTSLQIGFEHRFTKIWDWENSAIALIVIAVDICSGCGN
jgi:hypothetical protein